MPQIRVALIGLPPMLVELLCELALGHDDLKLTAIPAGVTLPDAIARTSADVLILAPAAHTPATIAVALERHPRLRTITLVDDGSRALVVELRPCTQCFVDVSPQTLLRVIEERAADWAAPAGDDPSWRP